jgi:hypothetical protein
VGVDPEQADFLVRLPEEAGDSGYGSGCYGMIASEDERGLALIETLGYQLAEVFAGGCDLGQETCTGWTGIRQAFGLGYVDVTQIGYCVAELVETAAEARYAQG